MPSRAKNCSNPLRGALAKAFSTRLRFGDAGQIVFQLNQLFGARSGAFLIIWKDVRRLSILLPSIALGRSVTRQAQFRQAQFFSINTP
jgi:hypothetical protein